MSDDTFTLATPPGAPVIEITRWFPAAPATLFRLYTEPKHLVQFWGSEGCTHPVCEIDFRVGGTWRHTLRIPTGQEFPTISTFTAIDPPYSFSYEWNAVPDPIFGPVLPPTTLNTMEFHAENGGTRVIARVQCVSVAARDGQVQRGFAGSVRESFTRLDAYLPGVTVA